MPRTKTTQPSLNPGKKEFFFALTAGFPFLVLLLCEGILRTVNYGGDLDLVLRTNLGGREYYQINRSAARRYFGRVQNAPEPADDRFSFVKGPNTRRIFCLGESTMAGFPFDFNATPASMMRERLARTYPGYDIQVVNIGLSGVSSPIIRDMFMDALEYEPDLIVLYLGHNEFYGAFGTGSTIRALGPSWTTNLVITLLRFRTVLAIRDLVQFFGSGFAQQQTSGTTLMEQLAADQAIPYGSRQYVRTREVFHRNLSAMLATAGERDVPVLVSTVVSNLRNQPPFRTIAPEAADTAFSRIQRRALERSLTLMKEGNLTGAESLAGEVVSLDPHGAGGRFILGEVLYAEGQYEDALRSFERARDLDGLRFRMAGDFQDEIISVTRLHNAHLARIDSAFAAHSPHGIVGSELMMEHLHPNLPGYSIMAQTWTEVAVKEGLLNIPANPVMPDPRVSPEVLPGVTRFDSLVGAIRIEYLTHRWPFSQSTRPYAYIPSDPVGAIALRYVRGATPWQAARYELAAHYQSRRQFDMSRREAEAVALVLPSSYEPLLRVADYYLMEGRTADAEDGYRKSIEVEENPFARVKLGFLLAESGQTQEAIQQLEGAFAAEQRSGYRLPAPAAARGRYTLGYCYMRQADDASARRNLRGALAINPDLEEARILLGQIERH